VPSLSRSTPVAKRTPTIRLAWRVEQAGAPQVEPITGLPPAIALQQRRRVASARSIADVPALSVRDAREFLADVPAAARSLRTRRIWPGDQHRVSRAPG